MQEAFLSFYHVRPGDQTQVARLSGWHLYPLKHLANPLSFKNNIYFFCMCTQCAHVVTHVPLGGTADTVLSLMAAFCLLTVFLLS